MKCITAQLTVIFQLDRVEERGRDPTRWIKVVQNDKKKKIKGKMKRRKLTKWKSNRCIRDAFKNVLADFAR